jgi:hypothetical protein
MKTKTIGKIQSLLRKEVDVINDNDAFRFITKTLRLLDKEKQRKEQRKNIHVTFASFVCDSNGVREVDPEPYRITPTGKVIINDGEKFEEVFMKMAKAYLDNKGESRIVIVKD